MVIAVCEWETGSKGDLYSEEGIGFCSRSREIQDGFVCLFVFP